MSLVTLLLLAVALGTDAFSLCIGLAITGIQRRQALALVLAVLVFHIAMPIIGWWLGGFVSEAAGRVAAYLAAAVLVFLGLRMILDGLRRSHCRFVVINGLLGIIVLAAGVSVDALSVGFILGVVGQALFLTALVIGLVAGAMTAAGLFLGRSIHRWVGNRAQVLGGIVLIAVGLHLIV